MQIYDTAAPRVGKVKAMPVKSKKSAKKKGKGIVAKAMKPGAPW